MKSMLRENYGGKKRNLELETAENSNDRLKRMTEGKGGGGIEENLERSQASGSVSGRDFGGVDEGKEWPRFRDIGGMDEVIKDLIKKVIVPFYHPQLPRAFGVRPISGILLHGPPGCGKTMLAHAIANETGVPFHKISAAEVVSGVYGASEEKIRELFSKAYRTAPSIVFIDEIDAIASKRGSVQKEMEHRIVTALMTCMEESYRPVQTTCVNPKSKSSGHRPGYVLVIGATNRPDAIDPALRRPGRFDREIVLGVPEENAKLQILSVCTRNCRLGGCCDLKKIVRCTPGFVGADLADLINEARIIRMGREIDERTSELSRQSVAGDHADGWWKHLWWPDEMEEQIITMADLEEAAKVVQPSSKREGFSAIPNVKWEDVGGLDFLRHEFNRRIIWPIKYPKVYERARLVSKTGILLYGPPGCGKTLIAKAVATVAGASFIHVKGPEILNKYVGESELQVRKIFDRARRCSPCILFFDEIDALTIERGKEGGPVVDRILDQLLVELDGAEERQGVYVIGATNRPEVIDRALLRPGRLGKLLYVPLPSPDERGLILKALAREKSIDADVDLMAIGRNEACENLSGADLSALMDEATMVAIEENLDESAMAALEEKLTSTGSCTDVIPWTINRKHVEQVLQTVSPSVTSKQKQYYQIVTESFRGA